MNLVEEVKVPLNRITFDRIGYKRESLVKRSLWRRWAVCDEELNGITNRLEKNRWLTEVLGLNSIPVRRSTNRLLRWMWWWTPSRLQLSSRCLCRKLTTVVTSLHSDPPRLYFTPTSECTEELYVVFFNIWKYPHHYKNSNRIYEVWEEIPKTK